MVKKQKEAAAEKIDCKNEEKKEPIIEEKKEFTNKKNKKIAHKKLSTNDLLEQINFSFSRDAVWFKKTLEKIDKVKSDLDQVQFSLNRNFIMSRNAKKKLPLLIN